MAKNFIKSVVENMTVDENVEEDDSPDIYSPTESCDDLLSSDVGITPSTSNHTMGLRTSSAPLRGRSVKEYEDQLSGLKRENFNLKLRIYFLEERMGTNFSSETENVVKNNVELMVEVASLKKETEEKHELLCQAVKAMELEDEENKKALALKDEKINECLQEIEGLKSQLLDLKPDSESGFMSPKSNPSEPGEFLCVQGFNLLHDNKNTEQLNDLQEKIKTLQEELAHERESSAAIQLIFDQKESKIRSLMSELDEVVQRASTYQEEARSLESRLSESTSKYHTLHQRLIEKNRTLDQLSGENEQLRKRIALVVAETDKERRRHEKVKAASELKISDLQGKLETALSELKKSQDLVVSKSPARGSQPTEPLFLSVSKPTTPVGSPQKDQLLPLPSPLASPTSSPASSLKDSATAGMTVDDLYSKVVKLKAEQLKACRIIKSMIESRSLLDEELDELRRRNAQLERELEGVVTRQSGGGASEKSMDEQSEELVERYKTLTDELEEKNKVLKATLTAKDSQLRKLQERYEEINKGNKEKEEHIVDLEFELLSLKENKDLDDYYSKLLKERDEEITRLGSKLQKRNCDLQGLVNKELWEKNREIEKMQKNSQELETLQRCLQAKDSQLAILKQKISELGIEVDLEKGDVHNNLEQQLHESEKLRLQANEVCGVLSKRLEELAIFLDSLLKKKSVLGFLGNKENVRLRQIIDQSLDLSRTFTMSMIVNPEASLMQLTNISCLLNDDEEETELSLVPANLTLTYQNHLCNKDTHEIIQTLRQQIVKLNYEVQLRDMELMKLTTGSNNPSEGSSDKEDEIVQPGALNNTSTTLKYKSDNQSESEAWSEPDRSVSRARIGLERGGGRKIHGSTDSTEDDDEGRSPRSSFNKKSGTIIELHKQVCELEELVDSKTIEIEELRRIVDKSDQKVAALEKEKLELLEQFTTKDKELENKINCLEVEKIEALKVAQEAEKKLVQLESDHNQQLQVIESNSLKKLKDMQNNAELEIQALHDTIEQLQDELRVNYVKKCEVEAAIEEIRMLKCENEELEEQVESLTMEEIQIKNKLQENEDRINDLRNELDNATLQYSEAVLEKTRIANEKSNLEQELSRTILKELDTKKRLDEVDNELTALKHTNQQHSSLFQLQKSKLEVRVSELESSNAELHNRLIKIQAGCGDYPASASPPNFVNQIVTFRRQHSDSSYVSEAEDARSGRVFNRILPNLNVDVERHEANSSPDLGIESDHGRFSSLETHLNVQRPLLQTLELTESMSNLLDVENNQIDETDCENTHCCRKTLEMANENSELKRKLLRTRRALEETVSQLTLANQRKKQAEKAICKQIHKTSQVLRKAKANLDSGSETDIFYNK